MRSDQRFSARCALAAALLASSPAAWALGLGDVTVESYLNQPLQVRIDLISQPTDDLESVTARLASAADYELIGASRESVSVPVRFSVEDIDGDPYIRASSTLAVTNPVLRLIVEVNWASGRMLREYTLFLDPPTVPVSAPPPPRIDQRRAPAAAPAPAPVEPEPAAASETPPSAAAPSSEAPAPRAGTQREYGPVRSGDTLWEIARDWPERYSMGINRVMIAIQRENPGAFVNGNINLLKRGAILRMPAVEDVENISPAAASREVAVQQERFDMRRSGESAASASTPLLTEQGTPSAVEEAPAATEAVPVEDVESEASPPPEQQAAADEEPAEDAVEESAAAPESPRDQLELVPPSAGEMLDGPAAAGGDATADVAAEGPGQLRESLARTEEELINQQQQNAYLEERIRELESRLEDVEERAVDDADLANMEDRLRDQRQAAAPGSSQPWYGRPLTWLVGLLILAAALVGWWFNRRGRSVEFEGTAMEPSESLQDIRGDAEVLLQTLSEDSAPEPQPQEQDKVTADDSEATVVRFPAGEGDAEVLDEESTDPEIQLDLARAYISMGDKEAARIILDEVVTNGNERQQDEARKMLDVLASP